MDFSSQGVVRVNTYEELLEAVRKVEEINKHDLSQFVQNEAKIIVEQFIDGPEFAIESFFNSRRSSHSINRL
ncbi:hypothetical protein GCM10020331_005600 [Ectobacillus funiculus]